MPRAIITGGAGFIGSNLVPLLLEKGWEVLVVDNFSTGKKENLPQHKRLKVEVADIVDKNKMRQFIKGADVVFHMAIQCVRQSINDPWLVHDVNATGTLSVLDAAKVNGIEKFIYVSSSEIYGSAITVPMNEEHDKNPTTVYGASKLTGELYALAYFRTYGYPTIIARPFNTYGYNEHFEGPYGEVIPRFVVRALNGLPLQIFGDGNQTRDFTFVTDTVKGIYAVYETGKIGEAYNIAKGKEISILNLADLILKICNVSVSIEHLEQRPGDVLRHFADTSKSERELGFKAQTGIEEGLKKYLNWFHRNITDPKVALKLYKDRNW